MPIFPHPRGCCEEKYQWGTFQRGKALSQMKRGGKKSLSALSSNFLRKLEEINKHSLSVYYNSKISSEGSFEDHKHASAVIKEGKIMHWGLGWVWPSSCEGYKCGHPAFTEHPDWCPSLALHQNHLGSCLRTQCLGASPRSSELEHLEWQG